MTKARRIAILGAGGFAQEVRWLIEEISSKKLAYEFAGYLVSDLQALGDNDDRSRVLGDLSYLDAPGHGIDALALGMGNPGHRFHLGQELRKAHPSLEWPTLIHPNVRYDKGSCLFAEGVLICAGTIATVDVEMAAFSMANLACTLGHGAKIGSGCVLNPTVNISGGVVLAERVLVGTGAQILQYIRVGEAAKVGAGAVVAKDVEAGATVVGVPAKPLVQKT